MSFCLYTGEIFLDKTYITVVKFSHIKKGVVGNRFGCCIGVIPIEKSADTLNDKTFMTILS